MERCVANNLSEERPASHEDRPNICVLIDFENMAVSADLLDHAVDLVQLYRFGSAGKNRADIRLAIDAMEVVFTRPGVDLFAIAAGDSDYSTLVGKLREYGKHTLGIGLRHATGDLLVKSCDEFIFYETLVGRELS